MNKTTFAPTAMVDGQCVTPEGWMWILSWALVGVPWAVKTATDPEYDMRSRMETSEKYPLSEEEIDMYMRAVHKIKESLGSFVK